MPHDVFFLLPNRQSISLFTTLAILTTIVQAIQQIIDIMKGFYSTKYAGVIIDNYHFWRRFGDKGVKYTMMTGWSHLHQFWHERLSPRATWCPVLHCQWIITITRYIVWDSRNQGLWKARQFIPIPPMEAQLLTSLLAHRFHPLSCEDLKIVLWGITGG